MMFLTLPDNVIEWEKINDDPVRPGLSFTWRKRMGPIFLRGTIDDPEAIVCTAMLP